MLYVFSLHDFGTTTIQRGGKHHTALEEIEKERERERIVIGDWIRRRFRKERMYEIEES